MVMLLPPLGAHAAAMALRLQRFVALQESFIAEVLGFIGTSTA
jgi:hypothetical protein